MTDQAAARHNMVESQLKPNRVTDLRVQSAMATIPRERFVPEHLSHGAYVDEATWGNLDDARPESDQKKAESHSHV